MKKSKLKALIVDDEEGARELLRYHLSKNTAISMIEEATTVEEALFMYLDFMPDIIFLDVVMPGRNGLDFIELLNKREIKSNVILVSGHKESAITAIKNNVYDFILKPIDVNKINKVIEKYRIKKTTSIEKKLDRVLKNVDEQVRIKISSTYNHTLISPEDILYCEAEGSYTNIHLDNGTREVANSYLGKIEKLLSDIHFFRISRSLLINIDKLSQVNKGDNSCILTTNEKEVKLYGSKKQIKILCEMDFE